MIPNGVRLRAGEPVERGSFGSLSCLNLFMESLKVKAAREYLDGLGSGKYLRIMEVLSYKGKFLNTDGNTNHKFIGIIQENVDRLEAFFNGKPLDDKAIVDLSNFVHGLLNE
ncbi:MAG: hypothetical protein HQL21_03990 [Candidatus Omnitrophica bacterium]|nr:hypothetical protein [Candidatus Omnitrophota bacterium]